MSRLLFLASSLLVLPLALLLFAQWPLRELVQAYSTQAKARSRPPARRA